jgi:large repetitive protein
VTPLVALAITKTVQSYRDGIATYLITVTDEGPNDTVAPLRVVDALPAGLTLRTASGAGWTCTRAGNTATCTDAARLAAGASTLITVVAAVTGAPGAEIDNVASVTGGGSVAGVQISRAASIAVTNNGTGSGAGGLSATGADVLGPLETALALLLGGALLLLIARRRRRS